MARPHRIGVYASMDSADGGMSQYALMVLAALREIGADDATLSFTLFTPSPTDDALGELPDGWRVARQPMAQSVLSVARRGLGKGMVRDALAAAYARRRAGHDPDVRRWDRRGEAWFARHGVDAMLFAAPHRLAVETRIPSIMAVHDIQHRLQPHFPEFDPPGYWEEQESIYRQAGEAGTLLLAESDAGREDLLDCYRPYGLHDDQTIVVPYTVPPSLPLDELSQRGARVRQRYGLPERYLFYPAQLWPHKNHARLVEALAIVHRRTGARIPLVLVGPSSGRAREAQLRDTMATAERAGVRGQIRYLGLVDHDEIAGLFAGAAAMVMPSFFGPTNLPVLEAWATGCPVVTSDIRGIRELCGDAALLVDPESPDEIAAAIHAIWNDGALASALAARGAERVRLFSRDRFREGIRGALARRGPPRSP